MRFLRLTFQVAVLAFATAANAAQTPQSQPQPQQSASPSPAPAPAVTAADITAARAARLDAAKRLLDAVDATEGKLKGDAESHLAALRRDFNEMVMAYWTSRKTSQTPQADAAPSTAGESGSGKSSDVSDWHAKFSDVERDLSYMVGGGESTRRQQPVATTGAAGESHQTDSDVNDVAELGPERVATLENFRRELELFYVETLDDTVVAPSQSSVGTP